MEDFRTPDCLIEFVELEGASTPFSEPIAFIFSNMIKEYMRTIEILGINENSGADRKPKGYSKSPGKYNKIAININDELKLAKEVSGTFLRSLCFPEGKEKVNGRSKKFLFPTYDYLNDFLKTKKKRAGQHWIDEWKKTEKERTNAIVPEQKILELDFKTNFTQVIIPAEGNNLAERFYSGYPVSFTDLKSNFDFSRNIYTKPKGIKELIDQHFSQDESSYILIKGVAGSGKTTLLKRIAFDLATENRPVFMLDYDWWATHCDDKLQTQIKKLVDLRSGVVIIIDSISNCIIKEEVNFQSLLEYASGKNVLFVFTTQPDQWNNVKAEIRILTSEKRFFITPLYRLEEEECVRLIDKLSYLEENSLVARRNATLSRDERIAMCLNSAERHLIIAMLQIRFGKRFSDIIADEYINIPSKLGKQAYLLVCFWHNLNMEIPESILWDSLNIETSLDIAEVKSSTEDLIIQSNKGYISRQHVIAREVCRNFINDKLQVNFHFKKTFSSIIDSKDVKIFLNDFFSRADSHKILVRGLEKDAALISHVIDLTLMFKNLFDKELLKNILTCHAKAEHILNNADKAIEIFKRIITEVDKTHSFSYRQIAWIETDYGNFEEAVKYAIDSAKYSTGVAAYFLQIAKILSLNTVNSFHQAEKYYKEAIRLSNNDKKYISEYEKYTGAKKVLEIFTGVMEDSELPAEVIKVLRPNLKFLRLYFGMNSNEFQSELLNTLHFMEADLSGTLEDLKDIIGDFNTNKNKRIKSKYYGNVARLKYLDWRNSNGVADIEGIIDDFNMSLDYNPKDPFTHCWLGTYYKEVERNFKKAEEEYLLAIDLSKDAEQFFDKDHPIFKNNMALLIIDEIIAGKRAINDLFKAEELLKYAVQMNNDKQQQFFWAEENLSKCRYFIESHVGENNGQSEDIVV